MNNYKQRRPPESKKATPPNQGHSGDSTEPGAQRGPRQTRSGSAGFEVHLILGQLRGPKAPTIKRWLLRHPRFVLHFTPKSASWLNLVERWFAEITAKMLRRGVHRSVADLEAEIRGWLENWNQNPRPYVWVKTADEILTNLARYCDEYPRQDTR